MKKKFRDLCLDKEIWKYRIHRSGVSIISPENKKVFIEVVEFLNTIRFDGHSFWNNNSLDRAEEKGYYPKLGPGNIKEYILQTFKGK